MQYFFLLINLCVDNDSLFFTDTCQIILLNKCKCFERVISPDTELTNVTRCIQKIIRDGIQIQSEEKETNNSYEKTSRHSRSIKSLVIFLFTGE